MVVLVPFPFSDLSQAKLRPAVVLADVGRGDWILCQITSNPYGDTRAILLEDASFAAGGLRVVSYARPGKLFTAHSTLMVTQVGHCKRSHYSTSLKPSWLSCIPASDCSEEPALRGGSQDVRRRIASGVLSSQVAWQNQRLTPACKRP